MPAVESESSDIRSLQTSYRKQAKLLEMEKAKRIIALAEQCDAGLLSLQKSLTTAGNLEEATAIQEERKKLSEREEVVSAKAYLDKYGFKPKTYVDETRGFAGNPVEKNNVYSFDVEQAGNRATLRFWASGDVYTNTFGKISLTPPAGEAVVVYNWKKTDFQIPADSVGSYDKLRPINVDVSRYVREPGTYKVTFKWVDGTAGLKILRVELDIRESASLIPKATGKLAP